MIELPQEIAHMIKVIEDAGFEAYAVGGCVRDSFLGRHPEDWDLTSNASRSSLEALFPHAAIVNKKLGVMRITEGDITADIAAFRIDGEYKDYRRPETVVFTQDIGEDLRRRDFTMNAIAVCPGRGVVDPYEGIADIGRKLIRGIGEPGERFEEDALRILRALRFAAQLGFAIDSGTLDAMKEKADLLAFISRERILEELFKTLTANWSGTGLRLLLETGALDCVLGFDFGETASEEERQKLEGLAEKIDLTVSERKLRLGVFYLCLQEEHARSAIEYLGFSNEIRKYLLCAVDPANRPDKITGKLELKRLICRIGMEHYKYLNDLEEQQCHINQSSFEPIAQRTAWLDEVLRNGEPIFLADLDLNGNDLKEAGIAEGAEIGRLLNAMLDLAHRFPEKNNRDRLMKAAREIMMTGIENSLEPETENESELK